MEKIVSHKKEKYNLLINFKERGVK